MSYFVHVTFDISNQTSGTDQALEGVLNEMGLYATIVGLSKKTLKLPANTFAGEFTGDGAGRIRDDLCTRIQDVFRSRGIKSDIFVTVGGNWAWGMRSS